MLYSLLDEPNERILQNQKTIWNITDLESEEGEGDESSTKISAILLYFYYDEIPKSFQ
jgi:hypothetical protein